MDTNKLSDNQINFIAHFFEDDKYPNSLNIAKKLVARGECIVAGHDCIWKGGIGNFIKTEEAEEAVDCLKYKFNLTEFISSNFFKEISCQYIQELKHKIEMDLEKLEEINNLNNL